MTGSVESLSRLSFDFVLVGGGTAGCVLAARLAEYLPGRTVLLIEAGPSDLGDERVLALRNWHALLGGELDYDYPTTEQPRGNSHIRHSRAKVLGGCSSHNTGISFWPTAADCARWEAAGAAGWGFDTFARVLRKVRNRIGPVAPPHRSRLTSDWVRSAGAALGVPVVDDFNEMIARTGTLGDGAAGFFSVAYEPEGRRRSSASVAYIHPILRGEEARPNLTVLTGAWVGRVNVEERGAAGLTATGVEVRLKSGADLTVAATAEVVLCAGAVDTPRLMLLSGLGPAEQLAGVGVPVVKDIPGVGENLLDHPETVVVFELAADVPADETVMDSDAGVFYRTGLEAAGEEAGGMMHVYQIPFCVNTARLGYPVPAPGRAFCMTPNVPRPASRGRVYLRSGSGADKPALDFCYFTDPAGADEAALVAGVRAARRIAATAPFSAWLGRELAPGPAAVAEEVVGEYARRAAHTVYHPAGTARMGRADDRMAVLDERLRVRGVRALRVCDAAVFPEMVTVNPMVTVLGVAERAGELVAEEWAGASKL